MNRVFEVTDEIPLSLLAGRLLAAGAVPG